MGMVSRTWLLPIVAMLMAVFASFHVIVSGQTPPAPPPPQEPTRTPYSKSIHGIGLAEAQTENISIGTAVPGLVMEVAITSEQVGRRVRAGDMLFRVDDRHHQAQLKVQQKRLAAARAELRKLQQMPRAEELPPVAAKVRAAEANVRLTLDLFERARKMFQERAIGAEEFTQRRLAHEVAEHQLEQAKAEYALLTAGAWDADKLIAAAAVDQAEAQIEQIQTDIERCIVRAPVDGEVRKVNVRVGEFVAAPTGQALMTLGSLQRLHVRVDVDENDIARFQAKALARASVRGQPGKSYPLTFVRMEPMVVPKRSLTGDNTERVDTRVMQVIYAVAGGGEALLVGQQLDVFIEVD